MAGLAQLSEVQAQVAAFKLRLAQEVIVCKQLQLDTKFSQQRIKDIQSANQEANGEYNWDRMCRTLGSIYVAQTEIARKHLQLNAEVQRLNNAELTQDFQMCEPALVTIEKTADDIFKCMRLCSQSLGIDQYPVQLTISNYPQRKVPVSRNDLSIHELNGSLVMIIKTGSKSSEPSWYSKMANYVWEHKTAIGLGLGSVILLGQTQAGAQFMGEVATNALQMLVPFKDLIVSTAMLAKENLPIIGSTLSLFGSIPNAISSWRAGNKKEAAAYVAAGACLAIAPHLVQPGASQKVLETVKPLASKAVAFVKNPFVATTGAVTAVTTGIAQHNGWTKTAKAVAGIGSVLTVAMPAIVSYFTGS